MKRAGRAIALATGAVALTGVTPAHAAVSVFAGTSTATCAPPDTGGQTVHVGVGSCQYDASAATCRTLVGGGPGVDTTCVATLAGAAPELTFVQFRHNPQTERVVVCSGSGFGDVEYRASPTSPAESIAVTIEVHGYGATFEGFSAQGTDVVFISGTFTSPCGGFGVYQGSTL